MKTVVRRKFTLIDAMVLIAATGIALVPTRNLYIWISPGSLLEIRNSDDLWNFGRGVHLILIPLVLTWATALWVLRLRQPRPRLRRVFRQPGMASCTAILCYVLFTLTNSIAVIYRQFGYESLSAFLDIEIAE